MDKINFTDRQELTLADATSIFDLVENEFCRVLREYFSETDVVIKGFEVATTIPPAMAVKVKVDDDAIIGTDTTGWAVGIDPATSKPVRLTADTTAAISEADASSARVDLVCIRRMTTAAEPEERFFWDPENEIIDSSSVYTRLLDDCEIHIFEGELGGSAPILDDSSNPISDNWLKLAEVEVGAGVTQIDSSSITDVRNLYAGPYVNEDFVSDNVKDFSLEHDKFEGVRRILTDLDTTYSELWSTDTKDWLDRIVLVYMAHQPMATINEITSLINLSNVSTSYSLGSISGDTAYIRVNPSGRLEFKLDSSSFANIFIRVEDGGSNS
ncbi:MAG: hypothetical protein GF399_03910 [Candidatus Coatesbacteria bacterium]|nr:hypothetical protein [Candidatus Coatesbacteria bacterium]